LVILVRGRGGALPGDLRQFIYMDGRVKVGGRTSVDGCMCFWWLRGSGPVRQVLVNVGAEMFLCGFVFAFLLGVVAAVYIASRSLF
jgi:hypothetical protein